MHSIIKQIYILMVFKLFFISFTIFISNFVFISFVKFTLHGVVALSMTPFFTDRTIDILFDLIVMLNLGVRPYRQSQLSISFLISPIPVKRKKLLKMFWLILKYIYLKLHHCITFINITKKIIN